MTVLDRTSGQRGSLELSRGVLEKIAGQAAREVTAVGGVQGGLLGIGGRIDLSARPQASVTLVGDRAEVRLRVAIGYPRSLRAASDAVRANVVERLRTLCGVAVARVDVEITALTTSTGSTSTGSTSTDSTRTGSTSTGSTNAAPSGPVREQRRGALR